jgi:hypothetical protein
MIIVTYDRSRELFLAQREGDIGMCIVGEGKSVAEAVGDWCIFSGKIQVKCDPDGLKEKYQAESVSEYKPFPRRG